MSCSALTLSWTTWSKVYSAWQPGCMASPSRRIGYSRLSRDVDALRSLRQRREIPCRVLYRLHPEQNKRSGAWMTSYKEQWIDERPVRTAVPHIHCDELHQTDTGQTCFVDLRRGGNLPARIRPQPAWYVCQFHLRKPERDQCVLGLCGTPPNSWRTLPSKRNSCIRLPAIYQTGELIPDELVQRIVDSSNFSADTPASARLASACSIWFGTRNTPFEGDVKAYERRLGKSTDSAFCGRKPVWSTQFSHIFAGGYSAGYYSYKWAEVLDADAFSLFKQTGIFNPETAASFRENILSKGGTEHPMTLYKRFRGQEPTIDALLIRNGIKNERDL